MADEPAPSGLRAEAGRLADRLLMISGSIEKLGITVIGAAPTKSSGPNNGPPLSTAPSMRDHVDRGHSLLTDIESEISRIEGLV
jgi:hypothetical protein